MTTQQTKSAQFHMMAKPTSFHCNLKCDYCFYLEKETVIQPEQSTLRTLSSDTMSIAMLKKYVRNYIQASDLDEIDFSWQGGEPTLAGIDFYRQAVKFQQMYANGKRISNSFQTNAIAINKQWAEFFAENDFLIGVSIDGGEEVHDKYRISVNGKPTFAKVKRAIELLNEHNVKYNTLTVINDQNWNKGAETYQILKSLGSHHMQFIPIVEVEKGCQQSTIYHYTPTKESKLTHFSVPAHGYGEFMNNVFDEWIRQDVGDIFVRMFDSILAMWMGYPATVCVQSKECGQAMVIEANGDVYSCDHYVYPANCLGNITKTSLKQLALSKQQQRFGKVKSQKLTRTCTECDVYSLCHGGCPKHRIVDVSGDKHRQNYLCLSYKNIFNHTAPVMHLMAQAIQQGGTALDAIPFILNSKVS